MICRENDDRIRTARDVVKETCRSLCVLLKVFRYYQGETGGF